MYDEDELLPISGLQHLLFCERRAALVHLEGSWNENAATAEGAILHEQAHEAGTEGRGDIRIARGLRLRSLTMGLTGMADVVEFRRLPDGGLSGGIRLDGSDGLWQPFLVEYKRGTLRHEEGYEIQLCAQAMCLEEMLKVEIRCGSIFYGKTRRRLEIAFDADLRHRTEEAAARLHELVGAGVTPKAVYSPKCQQCSLFDLCLPAALGRKRDIHRYLASALAETAGGEP
ncbi:MAG: CRISPR-associated protein Cas4 [Chloroflexi bacterium]|nr:CRISPR-associated protein Cas4 [Chloroflexota bacterium]